MLVIPASWEAYTGGLQFKVMPGKVNQDPYLKMKKKTKSKGMGDG
jgi:hypothetical protein